MDEPRSEDAGQRGVRPPRLTFTATTIDAPDAVELADFYRRLLGWDTRAQERDWVVLQPMGAASAGLRLSFQTEPLYVRPV